MAADKKDIKFLNAPKIGFNRKKYCRFQRKVSQAIKRARHIALLPYVADLLK